MTQQMGSYSDWRSVAPIKECPQCKGTHLRSRDCPSGVEVECVSGCGHREVLTDFTSEDFRRWQEERRTKT